MFALARQQERNRLPRLQVSSVQPRRGRTLVERRRPPRPVGVGKRLRSETRRPARGRRRPAASSLADGDLTRQLLGGLTQFETRNGTELNRLLAESKSARQHGLARDPR